MFSHNAAQILVLLKIKGLRHVLNPMESSIYRTGSLKSQNSGTCAFKGFVSKVD